MLELKAGVDFPLPGETIENPENAEKEETVGADAGSPAEEYRKRRNHMDYEGIVYRPPSEARSLIIQ